MASQSVCLAGRPSGTASLLLHTLRDGKDGQTKGESLEGQWADRSAREVMPHGPIHSVYQCTGALGRHPCGHPLEKACSCATQPLGL